MSRHFHISFEPRNLGELVSADREQLKRVLLYLCKNAVGRMHSGGKLVLRGYQNVNDIIIQVKDTGTRVAGQGNLSGLFSKIDYNGVALDLVVARQIVVAQGGIVDYKSEPNHETTFRIVLPLKPALAERAA